MQTAALHIPQPQIFFEKIESLIQSFWESSFDKILKTAGAILKNVQRIITSFFTFFEGLSEKKYSIAIARPKCDQYCNFIVSVQI